LGLEVVGDDLVHHLDAHLRDVFIVFAAKLSIFYQLFSDLPLKMRKADGTAAPITRSMVATMPRLS